MTNIIVITGPTATGKTTVGAMLAKLLDGEVVSADSMQVYKYMDIGTAKPSEAEMLGIRHHMLSIVEPGDNYSAARYISDAAKCIDDIAARGKVPILVGGTGLYIDSLISGRTFSARGDAALRKSLEDLYDRIGGEAMHKRLGKFDPISAKKLSINDKKRIVRAFEVFNTTGKTISQHDIDSRSLPDRYNATKIALAFGSRALLYSRIEKRVDSMVSNGLENEVRSLLDMGISPKATAMQAIGYRQMAQAIMQELPMEETIETIKMETRRYAKRQLSWLRRDETIRWVSWETALALGKEPIEWL